MATTDDAEGDGAAQAPLEEQAAERLPVGERLPVHLREPCEVASGALVVQHGFGFAAHKRNNVHDLGDGFLLTTNGAAALILNSATGGVETLFSHDAQGTGAVCVHPSKQFFAVGGKGKRPNVFIYTFPERKLCKILAGGTERAYASMAFSAEGSKLATVGSAPDFLLTVWDWQNERIILRNKAFAQEVYNVSFAPQSDGFLTTSGLGHIRFWRMAKTFTGLKLQGDIGKFGKVELSDVAAYAAMPDGKVLSGSESGSLLLWDGNFIKLELRRPGGLLPHEGEVNVCLLLNADRPAIAEFLTAGQDGWLRWWSMEAIDTAEIDDENPCFELEPSRQVYLEGVVPLSLLLQEGAVVVQDRNGAILRIEEPVLSSSERKPLLSGHAGAIAGVATSPADYFAATAGADGSVRLWDFVTNAEVYASTFNAAATSLLWAPLAMDATSRLVLVGFADGVLRALYRSETGWKLVQALKPHNCAITSIAVAAGGNRLATSAADGTVFVCEAMSGPDGVAPKISAVGFVRAPSRVNRVRWLPSGERILLACARGEVKEFTLPHPNNSVPMPDTKASFELAGLPSRSFFFKRRPLAAPAQNAADEAKEGEESRSEEELREEAEENARQERERERINSLPPGDVLDILPLESDPKRFILALDGADAGPLFVCSFESEHPIEMLANTPTDDGMNMSSAEAPGFVAGMGVFSPCTFLGNSWSQRFILNGTHDGRVRVRTVQAPQCYTLANVHDGTAGKITGVCTSYDDRYLLSTGCDGALFVHQLKAAAFEAASVELFNKAPIRIKLKKAWEAEFPSPLLPKQAGSGGGAAGAGRQTVSSPTAERNLFRAQPILFDEANDEEDVDGFDQSQRMEPPRSEPVSEEGIKEVADITDPEAYSIEDDKLKTEENTKRRLAEVEKNKVRKVIAQLRSDFEAVLLENEKDQPETQLERDEFNIDKELVASLIKEGKMQLEEVIKVTQWDVNYSKSKLANLKRFFLDELLVDNIKLASFSRSHTVQSFRTAKFSQTLKDALTTIRDVLGGNAPREEGAEQSGDAVKLGNETARSGDERSTEAGSARGPGDPNSKSSPSRKQHSSGWEARKAGRRVRKAEMQALMDTKPDEDADDPRDVAAIDWVMKNMGDYKLKSADDYQVPPELQVNAETKQRQSYLLAESVQALRMGFNKKFLALRELKRRIVETARRDHARVLEINQELGVEGEKLQLPLTLDRAEWPEKRLEFEEAELDAFVNGKDLAEIKRVADERAEEEALAEAAPVQDATSAPGPPGASEATPQCAFQRVVDAGAGRSGRTAFEKEEWSRKRKLLLFEKNSILDRSLAAIQAFDSAVYDLRKERAHLNADLAAAELRQILLSRELQLLKEFEKKDSALTKKLEMGRAQKAEVVSDITLCQERLASKKAEIEVWQEKDRIIMDEFNAIVGTDSNPVTAQLLKIFKRKMKRVKQRGEDGSEDEESEEEDEEDYDEDEEELEDGEPEEECCPEGCDEAVYEKVLELREKRLDQEEVLSEFNKAIDELRKANDRHQGREKQIDKELKGTVLEIQQFQNEKQRKLNEIDVNIVLKLDQIACLVEPESDDADEDAAAAAAEDEAQFTEEGFEEDADIDELDPDIQSLKNELLQTRAQMEHMDEVEDEEEIILQQEMLITRQQSLRTQIWRKRRQAVRVRERKSRLILPASVETTLVFDQEELQELHAGIAKLVAENKAKKGEYKDLHLTQKRLVREKRQKQNDIGALQAKCDDLQMLKFGQIIDLDTIEKMGSTKAASDLKTKFAEQEAAQRKEYGKLKGKCGRAQEALLEITRENSALLQEIAALTETQQQLEVELNNTTSSSSRGPGGGLQSHRDRQESARLTQLVRMQTKEINALKAEINLLRGSNPRLHQNQIMD